MSDRGASEVGEGQAGKISMTLVTPLVPSFIRTADGKSIPIEAVDDKTLRAMAKRWTALLLTKARGRRRAKLETYDAI